MYPRIAVLLFVVLVLAGFFGVKKSTAQSGSAFFQTIIVDPYSQALGEATVALRGYPGATSINPASIGRLNTVQFGSNLNPDGGELLRTPWLPDITSSLSVVPVSTRLLPKRRRLWSAGPVLHPCS